VLVEFVEDVEERLKEDWRKVEGWIFYRRRPLAL
jgi:hypothetical protein